MTLDTYTDLFDDDLDAVSTALDDARRAATEVKILGALTRMIPGFSSSETGCPWRDSNPQPFP